MIPLSRTSRIMICCELLAAACLAAAYIEAGIWLIVPGILAAAAFLFVARRRRVAWLASSLLVVYAMLAAAGAWMRLQVLWLLIGAVAALAAWDLAHFSESLRGAATMDGARLLERRHVRALSMAVACGLLTGGVPLVLKIHLPFAAAEIVGLILLAGLTLAGRRLLGTDRSGR
jgi:hypothetical protein